MLYRIAGFLLYLFFYFFYGMRSRGSNNVPAKGGAIIASNHASYLDPMILGAAAPHRQLSFMAKDELFHIPFFGWLIRQVHANPIKRGGANRHALKGFEELVKDSGKVLVLFPEGTRSRDGSLQPSRRGIGSLCLSASVPVIPALITGSYRAWPRERAFPRLGGRIEVRFGPPVECDIEELNKSGDPSGAFGAVLMDRIAGLRDTNEPANGFWRTVSAIVRAT